MTDRTDRTDRTGAQERRSHWIPWTFVWGFVVILAANGIMVFFAFDSFTGVSTDDSYRRGLGFNKQLEAKQRASELAWQVAARLDRRADGGRLTLALHDRAGRPLSSASVRAEFRRPIEQGLDFAVALTPLGDGRYDAPVHALRLGQWQVLFHIALGRDRITGERRFLVK
ncbi:MAG: FixH family protein [Rhodospirillaceae bacterium]|nr:FixH family protein [Rhodospirillaceae bacterium]